MKRKCISILLAAAMVTTGLVGCGGKDSSAPKEDTSKKETSTEEKSEKTEAKESITYWSMWNSTENQAKVLKEAADAYEAKTGVHVNIEWKGRDVKTLIGPALDAGEDVDLFDTDYMYMTMSYKKYLVDVTEMGKAADYEKHVMPVLLSKAKEWGEGKLYTMPYQPYTTGVWYDKEMFKKAGIEKEPSTWTEFLDVCQKLKDSGVNAITCNSDSVSLLYGFQLARYIGQEKINEIYKSGKWSSVPETKKAAEDIRQLWEKGYMSENAPANYPDGQNEIGFGETAMILQASWIPNEIVQNTGTKVDFGYFPWPAVEGGVDGVEGTMAGAQGFGIVAKSKKQQQAFDFVMSVVTGETDLKMAEAVSSIPADTENTKWPAVIAAAEPYFKKVTKSYDWAIGLEVDPEVKDILSASLIETFKGQITSDKLIENLDNTK